MGFPGLGGNIATYPAKHEGIGAVSSGFLPCKTLRVTPAMEAGIADRVWTLEEIVRLMM